MFGPHRLSIPAATVADHPGLDRYFGGDIVLGIRPEHLADAALEPDPDPGSIIALPVRLREELGSEVHIHGAIGKAAHVSGAEADDVHSLATMICRMDPRTKIAEGDTAKVYVDTSRLQFFDPETGDTIRS